MPPPTPILITGPSGFVGQNLINAWSSRPDLTLIPVSLRNGLDSLHSALDTRHSSLVTRHSSLIHLAGLAHDTRNASDPAAYFRINTELTQKVFDSFLNSDAKNFIYFSSVKAAADSVIGDMLTEEAEPKPGTPYGQSKLKAERYLLSNPLPEGKRLYILRPCMIHGPGNKGNLNLLYKLVRKGIPWPLGAFENQRSFLSIDNLLYLLEALLKGSARELCAFDAPPSDKDKSAQLHGLTPCPSGIYNLADDAPLSTNDLIRLIAEAESRKPRILRLPQGPLRAAARTGDFLHLPLNSERLKKLTESYVVSNQKLKSALGITSLPVTVEEGLRKTLGSFSQGGAERLQG
ncbi:MAG: NAD-dependent epimerase/dehydratase family protein [Verrucomicrobia bacterium]|nr:NAD-dependent epimerase/dehydratase family protein [Verrucomicrobiota bacterium]